MWESRVLCEISTSLWEPLFGFHRDAISTAIFVVARHARDRNSGGCCTPAGLPIVVPGASYAVVVDRSRCRIAHGSITDDVLAPRVLALADVTPVVAQARAAWAVIDPCDNSARRIRESSRGAQADRSPRPSPSGR